MRISNNLRVLAGPAPVAAAGTAPKFWSMADVGAVSYTHLDVYKRQAPD